MRETKRFSTLSICTLEVTLQTDPSFGSAIAPYKVHLSIVPVQEINSPNILKTGEVTRIGFIYITIVKPIFKRIACMPLVGCSHWMFQLQFHRFLNKTNLVKSCSILNKTRIDWDQFCIKQGLLNMFQLISKWTNRNLWLHSVVLFRRFPKIDSVWVR